MILAVATNGVYFSVVMLTPLGGVAQHVSVHSSLGYIVLHMLHHSVTYATYVTSFCYICYICCIILLHMLHMLHHSVTYATYVHHSVTYYVILILF